MRWMGLLGFGLTLRASSSISRQRPGQMGELEWVKGHANCYCHMALDPLSLDVLVGVCLLSPRKD